MTSLHRLIAIIVIWLVVAALGVMLQGLALNLPASLVAAVFITILLSAAAGTWAIARATSAGQ